MKNYFPFAAMPTIAQLNSRERRAIYCEQNGYTKRAADHWAMVDKGEAMRRDAGLCIYEERRPMTKAQRLYRELRRHLSRDDARYVATSLATMDADHVQRMMDYYTDGKFSRA